MIANQELISFFVYPQLLLSFLGRVTCHEQVNKMGLNNIAMIMAPNLFFQANSRASMDEIQKAAAVTDIMRMLIKYQVILWTVSGFYTTVFLFQHLYIIRCLLLKYRKGSKISAGIFKRRHLIIYFFVESQNLKAIILKLMN